MKKFIQLEITKNITIFQTLNRCSLGFGYSYEEAEEQAHLVWIDLFIWQLSIQWKPRKKARLNQTLRITNNTVKAVKDFQKVAAGFGAACKENKSPVEEEDEFNKLINAIVKSGHTIVAKYGKTHWFIKTNDKRYFTYHSESDQITETNDEPEQWKDNGLQYIKDHIINENADVWNVDVEDFELPTTMLFTRGSEFDDTSVESLEFNGGNCRFIVFRVDSTWYLTEEYKRTDKWVEEWSKQFNSDLSEAKSYAESIINKKQ